MKTLVIFLLLSTAASAAKQNDPVYQDAVLKSYRTIQAGMHCHSSGDSTGSVNTNTDNSGLTNGSYNGSTSTNTNCSPRTIAEYTILVGDQTFVIEPTASGKAKAGAALSLGWSLVFAKESCLYGQLPGSHIQIRSENGIFHVKVGKRESLYRLVAAQ